MPFSDFTHQHIFEPLQLSNTSCFRSPSDTLQHSWYYEPQADSITTVVTSGVQLYPCRDLITNMQDLTKYCQAIIANDSFTDRMKHRWHNWYNRVRAFF